MVTGDGVCGTSVGDDGGETSSGAGIAERTAEGASDRTPSSTEGDANECRSCPTPGASGADSAVGAECT